MHATVTSLFAIWCARPSLWSTQAVTCQSSKKPSQFRADYAAEIAHATDLGWYLARFGEELNAHLCAKRALWCIRTILIARGAERGHPIFAPQLLAEQTRSAAGRNLLTRRHSARDGVEVRQSLRLFLEEETTSDVFSKQADRSTFIERFRATSNEVALKTLQQEDHSQADYYR